MRERGHTHTRVHKHVHIHTHIHTHSAHARAGCLARYFVTRLTHAWGRLQTLSTGLRHSEDAGSRCSEWSVGRLLTGTDTPSYSSNREDST